MPTRLECQQGDIAHQPDMDAVVNAANAELRPGGGVAGALHRAAGPELDRACRPLAPIEPGEAVITDAFELPNRYVIHCLGPVYGRDGPEAERLADCYRNALELAERHGLSRIAFPALSAGAFGYPLEEAARIALATVLETLPRCPGIAKVRFVLFDAGSTEVFKRTLDSRNQTL
ncbi:macro domain-containing protein [Billgrantia pellis]|uniref:Macro domain-containing protein n=1 Tax=Billgrantia pellis TaxID=2606936 RepID=A0A7V7G0A3_9GAMM|nr:macro domain-containing protein [Halomonas pellis]KAA0012776.1 macro domain-containing protein [Halomonas pellis]